MVNDEFDLNHHIQLLKYSIIQQMLLSMLLMQPHDQHSVVFSIRDLNLRRKEIGKKRVISERSV
jgi:hypothetical protein